MTLVQQKTEIRNQKFDTVNGALAIGKAVVILPSGLFALAPVGAIPFGFVNDIDVQGQFSLAVNTERLHYPSAVSGTTYYYDNTVVGGVITTIATPIILGTGVSVGASEEDGYILLNIDIQQTFIFSGIVNTGSVDNTMTTFSIDGYDVFAIHNSNIFGTITTPYNAPVGKKWVLGLRTFAGYASFIGQHNLSQCITWIGSANNSFINAASSMMQDRTGPIDNNNVVLYHYPNTNDLFNVPNGTFNIGYYAAYSFQSGTTGIMSLSISPSYIGELKLVNI